MARSAGLFCVRVERKCFYNYYAEKTSPNVGEQEINPQGCGILNFLSIEKSNT